MIKKLNIPHLSKQEKILWYPAFCLLLIQVLAILYMNLFQMGHFTGFDASAYYVLAHEMVAQGKIMVDHYVYNTTTLLWDSPLLLAAGLHLFVDDIFVCYGISNVLTTFFQIFTLLLLADCLKIKWKGKVTVLILFLTPYISTYYLLNDLGYFSMLFISMGAYAWRLPILLWLYIMFLQWEETGVTKKNLWKFILGMSLLTLSSVSSGSFLLVFGIAPLVLFVLVRGLIEDKWLGVHHNVLYLVGILLGISFASQAYTKYVLKFASLDTGSSWVTLHLFWENLQSIFLGFMSLIGGIPWQQDTSVFTSEGILYGVRLYLAWFLLLASGYIMCKGIKKANNTPEQLISCLILSHLLIFTFLYTTYGATFFEIRYLIFMTVGMMLFCGIYVEKVAQWQNQSFRMFLSGTLGVALVAVNLTSYATLQKEKTDYDFMVEVAEFLSDYDEPVVYFTGKSEYLKIFSTNMRAVDFSKVYKYSVDLKTPYHCGDYDYYDDNGAHQGGTLVISVPWMFSESDPVFLDAYTLIHHFPDSEIYVYQSKENKVDLALGIQDAPLSIDFPYTLGVDCNLEVGSFQDHGTFLSNGNQGYLCSSAFPITQGGEVDFTIYYQSENQKKNQILGSLDIALAGEILWSVPIYSGKDSVVVEKINLDPYVGQTFSYSIHLEEGALLALDSMEFTRQALS